MRRRGSIWVWIIGLPIIFWAAAHWGFHYWVKSKIDEVVFQASPHADIDYAELETSLSGKINVRGIRIRPAGSAETISIQAIHVQGPDALSYLLKQIPQLGDGGPPEQASLVVKNMEVDISGNRAAKLDRLSKSDAWGSAGGKARNICEVGNGASFTQLQQLGLDKVQLDMKIGYQYVPSARKLYMNSDVELKDMQRLSLSVVLENVPALDPQKMMGVVLSNLKFEYFYSPEFGGKLVEYCAHERGLSETDFQLLMADEALRKVEQGGLALGDGLKHALKTFLGNWGSVLLELEPARPIGLFELAQLPRDQLADKLGLRLKVNGAPVRDLSFRMLEGVSLIRRQHGEAKQAPKPVMPRVEYVWEYHRVPVGRLSRYLDHLVVVTDKDGVQHKGILSEVSNGRISILKRVSGGKFTAHLRRGNVVSARVRVRVKVEKPESASQQADANKSDAGKSQAATEQGQQTGG